MNIVIIEAPMNDRAELETLKEVYPGPIELMEFKGLFGTEKIIRAVVGLTLAFGPVIVDFLINRKEKNKPTVIKIDGIEIEYNSKEELEAILKSYMEKNDKSSGTSLETIDLEAKGDVTIRVKQKSNKAQLGKIKSSDGSIDINIEQQDE